MDSIFIEGLRVEARVGVYAREQVAPQSLTIDLSLGIPPEAGRGDELATTIDYARVIDRVKEELAGRHFRLLERLGEHLVGMLFAEFDASWVRVKIAKIGVRPEVKNVGILLERRRDVG
ncbi:MAG: dihydroneopterin aldolase [Tepidiphilus sp.]|jgi:dihydroneopterin aldolase|uniref:dihydroneopterin aldolase n=1 Tax=Tepidiphilus thermophilus TaxID=876478 RepID=A0A0K6IX97_9PROT|nr:MULTISPECIES: dihydroneopterin aldolase [Tepidiphilus]MBP6999075.1 dihydroneopterin aldolase [Tepidiphilus sp.]MDK2798283.1 7,8-dihydroneopterin aldolase/epimerase/oxygenase [Tepidiphilus sp.]CUB07746.1 FolB domain [Tepidiphilus thermophilus]